MQFGLAFSKAALFLEFNESVKSVAFFVVFDALFGYNFIDMICNFWTMK